MIFLIVAVNLSITLLNIYIAVKIWQLRLLLARITAIMVNYESYFSVVLKFTPKVVCQGQQNIYLVRQRYQLIQLQLTKVRQLIRLLNWSYQVWRKT